MSQYLNPPVSMAPVGYSNPWTLVDTVSTLSTVIAAGYLNTQVDLGHNFQEQDQIFISYVGGAQFFTIAIDGNGIVTLSAQALTLVSDVTDYQQFVSLSDILINSVGEWTRTRVSAGNYSLLHTPAADTSVIGIDITPAIRLATGRGFKLSSLDVISTIGTLALSAHTAALTWVSYVNNVAAAVTSVPLTGSLPTATQSNPYVTNLVVTSPAFLTNEASKYMLELTVNAQASTAYSFYGLNLHFTKSVA